MSALSRDAACFASPLDLTALPFAGLLSARRRLAGVICVLCALSRAHSLPARRLAASSILFLYLTDSFVFLIPSLLLPAPVLTVLMIPLHGLGIMLGCCSVQNRRHTPGIDERVSSSPSCLPRLSGFRDSQASWLRSVCLAGCPRCSHAFVALGACVLAPRVVLRSLAPSHDLTDS